MNTENGIIECEEICEGREAEGAEKGGEGDMLRAELERLKAEFARSQLEANAENERLHAELSRLNEEKLLGEQKVKAVSLMAENGIPVSLAPIIVDRDDECMRDKAELIRAAIASAVHCEVMKRIPEKTPTAGEEIKLTREDIRRMPLSELRRFYD